MTAIIDVTGRVSVQELLGALGEEEVPQGCALSLEEEVEIVVTADADALWEEMEEERRDEGRETVPLHHLRDAIAALRNGDAKLALVLFDSVFDGCLSPEMGVIENVLLERRAA